MVHNVHLDQQVLNVFRIFWACVVYQSDICFSNFHAYEVVS